jgi:hypothetical protein
MRVRTRAHSGPHGEGSALGSRSGPGWRDPATDLAGAHRAPDARRHRAWSPVTTGVSDSGKVAAFRELGNRIS